MKYCTKCGYGNDDTADFCASCGENLNGSAQQSEATPYNASASDSGNAPAKSGNPATLWLVLNIVGTLCCGGVLCIIGIVFTALAMSAYNNGDTADGDSKLKLGKIFFWVGFGVGLLLDIVIFAVYGTMFASMLPSLLY